MRLVYSHREVNTITMAGTGISPDKSSDTVVFSSKNGSLKLPLSPLHSMEFTAESSLFISNPTADNNEHGPANDGDAVKGNDYRILGLDDSDPLSLEIHARSPPETPSKQGSTAPTSQPGQSHARYSDNSIPQSRGSFSSSNSASELSEADFQNSSFMAESRNQFDLDISLNRAKGFKSGAFSFLPSTSNSIPRREFTTETQTTSLFRVEELTKQLTECKIQLRLYDKFLNDLIDRYELETDDFKDIGMALPVSTSLEHSDVHKLVEDLYANLEDYQAQWRKSELRASDLELELEGAISGLGSLLSLGGDSENEIPSGVGNLISKLSERIRAYESDISNLKKDYEKLASSKEGLESKAMSVENSDSKYRRRCTELEFELDQVRKSRAEAEKLYSESQMLTLNRAVDDKLLEYQAMINKLQAEVNEFKDLSRRGSLASVNDSAVSSRDRDKFLLLQRDYDNLERLHSDMALEFEAFRHKAEATQRSLSNQLGNRKQEVLTLREEQTNHENLRYELDAAIEKQRVLSSEKMKFTLKVLALEKENSALKKKIDLLVDRVGSISAMKSEKKQSDIEFEELFRNDVREFEKLMNLFTKIADDASLEAPKRKLALLALAANENRLVKTDMRTLHEQHRFVFDYFLRAVDVVVSDHIRLLLKEGQPEESKSLRSRVAQLEKENQELLKMKSDSPSKTNLRVQALEAKWKSEREARVHENREAKRRLRELEEELMARGER